MELQSLAILVLVGLWFIDGVTTWLQGRRLRRVEQRLKWLEERVEGTPSGDVLPGSNRAAPPHTTAGQASPRVLDALRRGQKIEAIKIHREETGASLREAKRFVEGLRL